MSENMSEIKDQEGIENPEFEEILMLKNEVVVPEKFNKVIVKEDLVNIEKSVSRQQSKGRKCFSQEIIETFKSNH
jgi:hypothetical protein